MNVVLLILTLGILIMIIHHSYKLKPDGKSAHYNITFVALTVLGYD